MEALQKAGISLGASALLAIAIILIVRFGVFATSNLNASQTSTTLVGSNIMSETSSHTTTSYSNEGSSSSSQVSADLIGKIQ